ncbi:MAG: NapC/NirT family cytochrome c [Polyangiaceae bacterium]
MDHASPLTLIAFVCAAISAAILVSYLVFRPKLGPGTKIWLLLGVGVFPIGLAGAGNIQDFEATKKRAFCGDCHVMTLHTADSDDPNSTSLASRHARNKFFGSENCYVCHADYGMYGTVLTKMGGMRHFWLYYTQYRNTSLADAKHEIQIRKPFPNSNCMQCHSTQNPIWLAQRDHTAMLDDVRSGHVSCASAGCHGLAHPFWQTPEGGTL